MSRVLFKNDRLRFQIKKTNNKPEPNKSTDAIVEEDEEDGKVQQSVDWAARNALSNPLGEKKSILGLYKQGKLGESGEPLIIMKKSSQTSKPAQPFLPFSSFPAQEKTPIKTQPPEESHQEKSQKLDPKKESPYTNTQQTNGSPQKDGQNESEKKKKGKGKGSNKPKKEKKIKKQQNFVKLDLKRKYNDRFRGAVYMNKRMYMRNGQLKSKYRKAKENADVQFFMSKSYDIYLSSISKALYITLDDQEEQGPQSPKKEIKVTGTSKQELEKLISQIWGFESFRYGQYQTIKNVLEGKSTLFVSETGSGKSLTYILSSIVQDGLAIIISPLISLMLDQIQSIPQILPAACISSLLNHEQKGRIIDLVKANKIKLLYMTPQALQTDLVYHLKSFPPINFVCIDQAHCVSQLSHNFRTTYLIINELINHHFKFKDDKKVVLCLTATANNQTIESVREKMNIQELIRSDSLRRKNLCVTISRETHDTYRALIDYLKIKQISKLKGILIYCRSKKIINEVFNYLKNSGFRSAVFHAGLEQREKTQLLKSFRSGNTKIVIATVALGMGLDFENLDCVIHMNIPKSVESYVQEIGRAGRRGKRAYCHMFVSPEDYLANRNFILAERLEMDNIIYFIDVIQKYSQTSITEQQQQSSSGKKKDKPLKRDVFEQQVLFFSDEEDLKQLEQKLTYHKLEELEKQAGKICYARTKKITESLDLKSESIITILLKMEKISQKRLLRVLAPSHEVLKISFFCPNQKKVEEQSEFFRNLIKKTKNHKGAFHIRLIDKCNEMNLDPIDIISKLQQLSHTYSLKIEYQQDVILWRYVGEMSFQQFRNSCQQKLYEQMLQVDKGCFTKLNILYCLAFLNSDVSVQHMIKKNALAKFGDQKEPPQITSVSELFDEYFTTDPNEFYKKITEGDHYLPTWSLQPKQKQSINFATKSLLKNEFMSNPSVKPCQFIKKYRSGRIISRILLGINTEAYNWKTYGDHPYWGRFRDSDYDELVETIVNAVQQYMEQQ